MRQDIEMIRGRTETLIIAVSDADGTDYTLAEGEVLRFGIKAGEGAENYLLVKELTTVHAVDGGYALSLAPEDTEDLPAGRFKYDVGLQIGGDYYTVIPPSEFHLIGNVTERSGT